MTLREDARTTTHIPSRRSSIESPSPTPSNTSTISTSNISDNLNTPYTSSTSGTHDDASTSSNDTPSNSSSFDTSTISSRGTNNSASEKEYLEPSSASSDPSSAVWKSHSLSDTSLLQWFQHVFTLVWAIITACLCWLAQRWTKQAKELQKQLDLAEDRSWDLERALEREKKDVADLKEMLLHKHPVIRDLQWQLKKCDQELVKSEMRRSELELWVDKLSQDVSDVRIEKKQLRQDIRRLHNTECRVINANSHLDRVAEVLRWRNEVLEKNLEVLTRQRDEVVRFHG